MQLTPEQILDLAERYKKLSLQEAFDPINLESRPTKAQDELLQDINRISHRYATAGNQCHAKGSKVLTKSGIKNIEDMEVGDVVFDENGKEQHVTKVWQNGKKHVSDLSYMGKTWATCTWEHKWLVHNFARKNEKHDVKMEVKHFLQGTKVVRQFPKASLGDMRYPGAYEFGYYQESEEIRTPSVDEVYMWDRESLLKFVAGVMDIRGKVYTGKNHVAIHIYTPKEELVDTLKYAFLALWQEEPIHFTLNGSLNVVLKGVYRSQHVLQELKDYLKTEEFYRDEIWQIKQKTDSHKYKKLKWGSNIRLEETYNLTVSGENNLYVMANGLVSSNSGKTSTAARECAWILTETHPYWKRRPEWGDEKLLLIAVGRTSKQTEEVIWRKIEGFLERDSYRIVRQGGALQKVVHKPTGNTLLFASHHNDNEAREKLQAFVAHYLWVDELPGSVKLIEEMHRRVQAKRGYFISTFTPKVPNAEIRHLVDSSVEPHAKKYQFSMLDNPIYTKEDKIKILDSIKTYPTEYQNTILYGDWSSHDLQVIYFDREMHVEDPFEYHPSWRHVECVDPAMKSKFGYTLWAENPHTSIWYMIKGEYIEGLLAPDDVYQACIKMTGNVNLVRRISDPHESWFIGHAASKGTTYLYPWNKSQRKGELIKNLQSSLGDKIKIASWCENFIKEVESAQWSETQENKIVNGSSYHLLDCAQYFVDLIPKAPLVKPGTTWHEELRIKNNERKKKETLTKQLKVSRRSKWIMDSNGRRRLS